MQYGKILLHNMLLQTAPVRIRQHLVNRLCQRFAGGLFFGSLLALILSAAGCKPLTPPYEPSAFGPDKVYALVTIVSDRDVEGGDTTTVRGALSSGKYYFPARDALARSVAGIESALSGHKAWRLLPPEELRAKPAWQAIQGDPVPPGAIVAPGYKFFHLLDTDKLAKLARDLDVDGIIILKLDYRYTFTGTRVGRLAASGKTHPVIRVDLRFHDRDGRLVYRAVTTKTLFAG